MPNPQSPATQYPEVIDKETLAPQTLAKATPANTATPKGNPEPKLAEQKIPEKNKRSPTKKPLEKLKKAKPAKTETPSPTEFMATEYKGVSIYALAMTILIGLILWTGIATVQQVQAYHQQYGNLQQLKKDYRKLQIENQRLLIEQQTFSATPQIASRAVAELNMFYPQLSDRMIIQADNIATKPTNFGNTATATAQPPKSVKPISSDKSPPKTSSSDTAQPAHIENAPIENAPIENAHITNRHTANLPQIDNASEYAPEQNQDQGQKGQGANP